MLISGRQEDGYTSGISVRVKIIIEIIYS